MSEVEGLWFGFVTLDCGGILAVDHGVDDIRILHRARGVLGVNLLDDLLDAILGRDRFVEDELHFGRAAQRQPLGEQMAHEAAGALERFLRLLSLVGVADDGPVDARERQIGRDLGAGHGNQTDARIPDFGLQHLTDFFAHLFLNALDSM